MVVSQVSGFGLLFSPHNYIIAKATERFSMRLYKKLKGDELKKRVLV